MLDWVRGASKALYISRLKKHGLTVGRDFQMEKECNIDSNFPWLIEIGDNVTFASHVAIIAHDGSTKKLLGYSKVGKVIVGSGVFLGYGSIVMPNVRIGDGAIIGANSLVNRNVGPGMVAVGSPAKEIMTVAELTRRTERSTAGRGPYDDTFLRASVSDSRIERMRRELDAGMGLIV